MSTFKGLVAEFPDIRIDFFRRHPELRPPLACFLSHVHSDHLAGLESLKAPFVYCSPATREILLRLEKYQHRMNFARGILESRKQTYKHLDKLLKPIPLETPTKLELEPGNTITVTLFDANHCPGSVMFLIENEKSSILYTGDIRSEPSFVDGLRRNPYLIPYTTGLKTLECLYLDTSNTEPDRNFPSKAEGLGELLQKVKRYPDDTIFHFSAWTYGYEDVWKALAKTLNCQVHVDRYKMRIYKSLVGPLKDAELLTGSFISPEGPALAGYSCGNSRQEGCLTENPNARIHSCEKGLHCPMIVGNENVVRITPIVARLPDGSEITEIGVGGGGGDLKQDPELELANEGEVEDFLHLLDFSFNPREEEILRSRLHAAVRSSRLFVSLCDLGIVEFDRDQNEMPLKSLASLISKSAEKREKSTTADIVDDELQTLPRRITFPYARHSSFQELCHLLDAFKPKDVYPCTVDEENWHEGVGVRIGFGKYCSGSQFRHDYEMRQQIAMQLADDESQKTHTTESDDSENSNNEISNVVTSPSFTSQPRCNSEGQLQRVEFSDEAVASTIEPAATPLSDGVISKSPGFESQQLRRKLIVADLEDDKIPSKKSRLTHDQTSPLSSRFGDGSQSINNFSPEIGHNYERLLWPGPRKSGPSTPEGRELPGSSAVVETPSSEEHDDDGTSSQASTQEHKLRRCQYCENEVWSVYKEFCVSCVNAADETPPYYEVQNEHGYFEIALDEYTDEIADEDLRQRYVGEYLDVDSSAYDTQDEEADFREEYEINSFIDDSSSHDGEEGDTDESDDEDNDVTFWQQKFEELQMEHNRIVAKHDVLQKQQRMTLRALEETETLYHDLLDYVGIERSDDEDDDFDEEGIIVVHPVTPDPVITEVILTSAQEQSQESEVMEERNKDGADAFEAHHVSLISTGSNQAAQELEL